MFSLRDFSNGVVWDTESRAEKSDDIPFDIYKGQCGISIAVIIGLEKDPLDHVEFYSDADEEPWGPRGLLKRLSEAGVSIGYNSLHWDHAVLRGVVGYAPPPVNELDLYRVIRDSLDEQYPGARWAKGTWTLDAVAGRTFRKHKTQTGSRAPTLAKEGRWGELVKYCYNDVLLTRQLAWHMSENGYVVGPESRIVSVYEVMNRELGRIRAQAALGAA